jgi:hypothetical protein
MARQRENVAAETNWSQPESNQSQLAPSEEFRTLENRDLRLGWEDRRTGAEFGRLNVSETLPLAPMPRNCRPFRDGSRGHALRTARWDQRCANLPNRPSRANPTVQSPVIWGMPVRIGPR